jgi:DUF971 family protein
LVWSDGHSTGIYAWSYLRSLWDEPGRDPGSDLEVDPLV